jgi:superfamily II RNA helicase
MIAQAPLAALLPRDGPLGPDAALDRFLGYVASTGLTLYPAQEEALLELAGGKHVLLNTPTGSGKSLVAMAMHFFAAAQGQTSYYTCPIKALVNEKFFALCQLFGAQNVGMMTGDATINRDAPIICCTAEILSNFCLRELAPKVDQVVMDEFHYYADRERGVAWQLPLITLEKARFLLMSATLGDTSAIEESLAKLTGREVAAVRSATRPVPLRYQYAETPLHETIADLVQERRAPVYLVNFTQRTAAEQAQNLMSMNFSTKEEKDAIRSALEGARFDTPYGKEMQRFVRHGIGLHHAGLLPKYRLLVEKLAQGGMLKVISGTDTLGVGVNIPLRTVLFTQMCKFDGEKTAILSARDFHQISGRAGRKGFDEEGHVVAQAPEHVIENLRLSQKAAAGKKVVKKQPPQKGYVHWDQQTFERLITKLPEPLESRFEVTHGMLLNLLQSPPPRPGGGYARLVELIGRAHLSDWSRRAQLKRSAVLFRALRGAGIVGVAREWDTNVVRVSQNLQHDFSLNHTLSLFLHEVLKKLDPTTETYALDLVTMVESILENPTVVLVKQLDKLKGEKVAELKAQGMEYEQRMEELDKLEWPKPHADFIYAQFNEFAAKHPWVAHEDIRPKAIARDLFERFCSFHDYVREYGLERSEGVLLRYLGEVYKALLQSVPEALRNEELEDLIAQLRVMLRQVDSSLLEEWESLARPGQKREVAAPAPAGPVFPDDEPRAFARRVRAELQALMRALGTRQYEEALGLLAGDEWTEERLETELAPFFAAHPQMDLTPRTRRPQHSHLKKVEPHLWEASQSLFAPETPDDEAEFAIECEVDVRAPPKPDAPLLKLRSIRGT